MDIFPQDLGPNISGRIVQLRIAMDNPSLKSFNRLFPAPPVGQPTEPVQVVPLNRALNRRLLRNVLRSSYFSGLGALVLIIALAMNNITWPDWGILIAGSGGGGIACLMSLRRRRLTYQGKVTRQEIQVLAAPRGQDDVTQEYLQIVLTLLALTPPDGQAKSIQSALRSLGAAIDKLPAPPAAGVFADAATLHAEASRLTDEAGREADGVVAASLGRQAKALTRRAETTARAATLVRRNRILRDEVAAQVKAFQTSLAAAQINGGHAGADFDALAESVAHVAQEADALADAQVELEAALAPPPPHAALEQDKTLTQNARR